MRLLCGAVMVFLHCWCSAVWKMEEMGGKIMAEREKERLKSVREEEEILSKTKGEGGAGLFGFL
jgi:hypothetical protein